LTVKSCLSVLVIFVLVGAARGAWAADWWYVQQPKGQNESLIYIDKSSMERVSQTARVTAWVWTVFRKDQSSEMGDYRSAKYRLIVDCETKEAGAAAGTLYSSYGKVKHQFREPSPDMEPIAPGTAQETAATFFCSGGKQPDRSIPVYDPSRDFEQRFLQRERETGQTGSPASDWQSVGRRVFVGWSIP
jgi:hypothetical protein